MNAQARTRTDDTALSRYLAIGRRRWGILVALVVLSPCVATVVALQQEKMYEATSSVLISRQSVASQLAGSADVGLQQQSFQQVLVTQARLARTPTVLRDTVTTSGAHLSVDALRDASAVDADPNSDLLTFSVKQPKPMDARRIVVSYAKAYVRYRQSLDSRALTRALSDVDAAIARARADRETPRGALASSKRVVSSCRRVWHSSRRTRKS